MSQLIISKKGDNPLIIIRNLGTIELDGPEVHIQDSFGSIIFNIFTFNLEYSSAIYLQNLDIYSSNHYEANCSTDSRIWYLHISAYKIVLKIFQTQYLKQVSQAVKNKTLDIHGLIVSYNDEKIKLTYEGVTMEDTFQNFHPSNYYHTEQSLLGEHTFVYIETNRRGITSLEFIRKNDTFPEAMYSLKLGDSTFKTLSNFINQCWNLKLTPEV